MSCGTLLIIFYFNYFMLKSNAQQQSCFQSLNLFNNQFYISFENNGTSTKFTLTTKYNISSPDGFSIAIGLNEHP